MRTEAASGEGRQVSELRVSSAERSARHSEVPAAAVQFDLPAVAE